MKTTSSTIEFKDAKYHPQLATQLKPSSQIVEFYDNIEDIGYLSVSETPEPLVTKQPLSEKHPMLLAANGMQIPVSLMRMIEDELRDDNYDLRTVLSACCGMVKETREFNDAYIAARILSHSGFKRHSVNVQLIEPCNPDNPYDASPNVNSEGQPASIPQQ